MKKNNKKIIIIISLILVSALIVVLTLFVLNVVKDKKESNKNMQLIKDNYNELSTHVSEYNQIRTNLSEKLNDFIYETYPKEHDSYVELLNKYNDNIKNIDTKVNNINNKCDVLYSDISINKICDSYKVLYEKLINLYITDINIYNNKIKGYNQYKEKDEYQETELIHKEYLDYNQDKIYEGKDVKDEEDKENE